MNTSLIHLKLNGAYFKLNNNEAESLVWTTSDDNETWSTKLIDSIEAKNHLKLLDSFKKQSQLRLGYFQNLNLINN